MATARELLEQADALMRRNRANAHDDIPVLTDVMPAVAFAPAPRTAPSPADLGPPSVPLLTENIDVIDEDVTMGAEAVEGEPSAWLEFDDENPSVIGDAPDSIAFVPPVALRATPPDEALLASAEHEEIEFTLPVEEMPADQMPAAEVVDDVVAAAEEDAFEGGTEEAFTPDSAVTVEAQTAAAIEADADAAVGADFDAVNAAVTIVPAASVPLPAVPPPPVEAAGLAALAAAAPAFAAAATPAPAVAPVALAMADDDERWIAAAEEIRMQVLQRIDLFTDTGLRDQLTQRLQPIADRASADFVKAINLHVGDLLRTYVAEAIEREIERWRRDH